MRKEYWRKRAEEQMIKNHLEADKVIKRAERFITDAEIEIEADIFKWYVRIADNNEIGFEDAKKLLKADELEEFHWTVDEYIKYGKENAMNEAWMKELENASAKVHINRLEQAKLEMRQAVEKAYNRIDKSIGDHAKGIVKDTYMRTAYDFQKGIGLGWSFSQIDDKKLAQLISMPWASDGKCFSDRLWTNKTALVENLNKELSMWVLRGDSIQNMTKRLSSKMNVDKKKCARLIRTETTFIAERASLESYKELGVEKVEIIGTLDSTTCEVCGSLDGTIVRLTDMEAGITTPPFHPSCRCTTAPYDEEDFTEVRTARNEDGEVYEVPGDMSYKEWRKGEFSNNLNKNIIILSEIISGKEIANDIQMEIERSIGEIQEKYEINIDEIVYTDISEQGKIPFQFNPVNEKGKLICQLIINKGYDWNNSVDEFNDRIYNKNYKKGNLASQNITDLIYHEMAHFMTFQDCKSWQEFLNKERNVRNEFIFGISNYNNVLEDGAETIAEGFVAMKNNELISEEIKKLVERYIGRYRK